ncbi:MAG: hypothetical protein MJ082_05450 [Clostridia bacterium]|nr:hypothetical protein [Clostridia bacterium]
MEITEIVTITEFAGLLKKSRPTVYKILSDYGRGNRADIPTPILNLLDAVKEEKMTKAGLYAYCEENFCSAAAEETQIGDITRLLMQNRDVLDLKRILAFIQKEVERKRR